MNKKLQDFLMLTQFYEVPTQHKNAQNPKKIVLLCMHVGLTHVVFSKI